MNKLMKKVITSATALGILTTMSPTLSFASTDNKTSNASSKVNRNTEKNNVSLKIIKDDNQERVVQSSDSNLISISTYNKITKTVSISTRNLTDNLVSNQTIDLNTVQRNLSKDLGPQYMQQSLQLIDKGTSLDEKWYYYYYTNNVWLIKIPGQRAKNPIENSSNSKELNGFRSSVLSKKEHEIAFTAKVSGEAALAAIALCETPTPWTTVAGAAAAIGIAVWAIPDLFKVYQDGENCTYYYQRI
ncbi:geobacillin-26 family protein [Bacillus sp. CGMCC 1.60114]|uniref:geobacillin-26 family protein n=1 Tax=unclassified Bacillus (in: firmicutes) TaxID=185979 RepID=UPI00363A7048